MSSLVLITTNDLRGNVLFRAHKGITDQAPDTYLCPDKAIYLRKTTMPTLVSSEYVDPSCLCTNHITISMYNLLQPIETCSINRQITEEGKSIRAF